MERDIARFSERITIQKNTVVVDALKNHRNTWSNHYSCFAYAGTYQYDSEKESVTTSEEQTIKFEVRYCPELTDLESTGHRVLFRNKVYDIVTVDFMNFDKKTIRIVAKLSQQEGS